MNMDTGLLLLALFARHDAFRRCRHSPERRYHVERATAS